VLAIMGLLLGLVAVLITRARKSRRST